MSKFQNIIGAAIKHWLPEAEILENHRPDWLFGMELDFYLPSLNLAIEVNGKQHYRHVAALQPTRADFLSQRKRDVRKKRLLIARGIRCIVLRQKRSWVVCGLQGKLQEMFPECKFAPLPKSLSDDWKQHASTLHQLSVGREQFMKERAL